MSRAFKMACLVATVALLPSIAIAAPPAAQEVRDGRTIAVAQCGRCHGLDHKLQSPRRDAPPFRLIGRRYQFPVLEEELIQGVKLGHPDMPRFQLAPQGVDALIAYLRSIQDDDRRRAVRRRP